MKKKITTCLLLVSIFFAQILTAEEKFVSLKKSKVNVRYGQGKDHAIKYIYRKINLPIKQIDKKENWRRIVDLKNNSGWIHLSQLKPSNSFIILKNKILFKRPSNFSKPIAKLKKGRLLIIKKCKNDWCNVITKDLSKKYSGWVKTDNIWGNIK